MLNNYKFHHIGMASRDIEKDIEKFKDFFGDIIILEKCFDILQNVELCIIDLNGIKIEIVSGDPVKSFLERKINFYHLCYEVENINETIEDFVSKGAVLISEPKEAILFNGRKVAFIMLPNYMIVEFLEKNNV